MKKLKAAFVSALALCFATIAHAETNGGKMDNLMTQVPLIQKAQSLQDSDRRELTCLALTIYHEARGVAERGKIAVAHVILNRVSSGKFADTICGVVWQKSGNHPQFSWTIKSIKGITPRDDASWEKCQEIAYEVLFDDEDVDDPTHGATHFYNVHVRKPAWAYHAQLTVREGQHIFVRPRGV